MNAELTKLANGKYGLPIVRELRNVAVTDVSGTQHPRSIWKIWTDKQLNEIGYSKIYESDIPEGKRSTGYNDSFAANKVTRTHTLKDIPPEPPEDNGAAYDDIMSYRSSKLFKAYVMAVNDESIVPGAGHTAAQLKSKVKAKM